MTDYKKLNQENYITINKLTDDLKKVLENKDLKNLPTNSQNCNDLQDVEENCRKDFETEIKISIAFFGGNFHFQFIF